MTYSGECPLHTLELEVSAVRILTEIKAHPSNKPF